MEPFCAGMPGQDNHVLANRAKQAIIGAHSRIQFPTIQCILLPEMVRALLERVRKNALKALCRTLTYLVSAFALAQAARANLVQDGDFTSVTYSGALPVTVLFGQFGSDPSGSPASGAQLTVSNWDTGGYNFVYTTATIDAGTNGGANAGQPNQAPGQFTAGNGYGNTYMWGSHNGGASTITAPPSGGNIIAADGAYEQGAITQTVTGLTVGKTYVLKFYFAGAQQQSFNGVTTEKWIVSMGTGNVAGNFSTATVTTPNNGFSGWQQATMYFYAGATTETLSFLAAGTPNGEPPFTLLAGVDLEVVPDFSNWMVFTGFGVACVVFEGMRRRRRLAGLAAAA
jgi:hypothetical protein